MTWVTIYDVRNGWGFWVAIVIALFLIVFILFIFIGSTRLIRNPQTPSKNKQVVALIFTHLIFIFLLGLCCWSAISDYRLRRDLNSGRFAEIEGPIAETHVEASSRSNTMYFRIGREWFQLPYHYSPECFPRTGERAKLAYETVADVEHAGPIAHAVLQMSLTHGCSLPVWG